VWFEFKSDISNFKVFRCEAWAHIPNEKHKVLQSKSEQCICVGYVEYVKDYKIFVPRTSNVIFRQCVHFDEHSLGGMPRSSHFHFYILLLLLL
jgi:hypothetical protein